jgi:hypothetical protein
LRTPEELGPALHWLELARKTSREKKKLSPAADSPRVLFAGSQHQVDHPKRTTSSHVTSTAKNASDSVALLARRNTVRCIETKESERYRFISGGFESEVVVCVKPIREIISKPMALPRVKLLEVVALLPATLVLVPVICASAAMLTLVLIVSVFDVSQSIHSRAIEARQEGTLLLLLLSGLLGLAGTWVMVLLGADRFRRNTWLRSTLQISTALGIIAGCYWIFWPATAKHDVTSWGALFWSFLLGPAIGVGVRQLHLLTTRHRRPDLSRQPPEQGSALDKAR